MSDQITAFEVATVTLNPAIDQTITIRNFTAGVVNRVEETQSNAGGKGVNVASALADYGKRVAVTGFLGRENDGLFLELFAAKKIADNFVRIDGQTRVGIKIADSTLHQTTDINFPGAAPASEDLTSLLDQVRNLQAQWYVVAGSIPPGVDPAIYRELTRELKGSGRKVLVDTSGTPLRHAIEAAPDIIKPNIHELSELVGAQLSSEQDVIQAARSLLSRGIRLVVVSMGERGACFVTSTDVTVAIPPSIEVKSTVGAGDAMVAGIVASQVDALPLGDSARLATAFSLDALSRVESGVSMAGVRQFIGQVQCR